MKCMFWLDDKEEFRMTPKCSTCFYLIDYMIREIWNDVISWMKLEQ